MFAQVVLPLSRYQTFTYKVPEQLRGSLRPGSFVTVPFRNRAATGVVAEIAPTTDYKGALKTISAVRDDLAPLPAELWTTLEWISDYYMTPLGLVLKIALPLGFANPAPGRKQVRAQITAAGKTALDGWSRRAPAQKSLLAILAAREGSHSIKELVREVPSARTTLRHLFERGLVELSEEPVPADPLGPAPESKPTAVILTAEQTVALEALREGRKADRFAPFLLRGVTSSGKTEVYFQAARETLAAGKSVLVLVPEIALTAHLATRFRAAFGETVALWHSRLSRAEKAWTWRQLQQGRIRVVVGARSAVFAPLDNLGLIIVDEEQEGSYKQEDRAPRYHARDVALVRGREATAVVVLASATPAVESYFNGLTERYRTLHLTQRYGGAAYPKVRMIDLRLERQRTDNYQLILTQPLIDGIAQRLERKEQVILLQNRRGFAPVCACNDCDFVAECLNCSVPLTYHKRAGELRCHYCGYRGPGLDRCPDCGSPYIFVLGVGTQQVEEVVQGLFPAARTRRMDADTTRSRHAHRIILEQFEAGDFDILIGTQMIAKGLDFERVTLVGVVNADTGLAFPDFRAGERTFQLVYQVCGRAGRRKDHPGEAIIQTNHPEDLAIKAAARLDAHRFYNQVLAERRELAYPPFARQIRLLLQGADRDEVWQRAQELRRRLTPTLPGISLLGPASAPFERLRGRWRFHLLLRSDREHDPGGSRLRWLIRDRIPQKWLEQSLKGVRILLDVDPVSLL